MEELILRYYLSLFSIFLFLSYTVYFLILKPFEFDKNIIVVEKNQLISSIIKNNFNSISSLEKKMINSFLKIYNKFFKKIKYGKFQVNNEISILNFTKLITNKSNIDYKITIIEGWEKYQLNKYLSSFYKDYEEIPYENLIADTYYINSSNSFYNLNKFLIKNKKKFFKKNKDNKLIKKYGFKNILIISSLVEKEAKNDSDKALISSVIFNRLNLGMKLQIDATVISSLTEGKFKLNRSLNYKDLKFKHPLNTYINKGIPKQMICYIGLSTIEIVLENNKSDFLFYFYNIIEKKHIFTTNFEAHKKKLNDYRKNSQ